MLRPLCVAPLLLGALSTGCVFTHHAIEPARLGKAARSAELLAVIDAPGPIELETINSSDWEVDRKGLINLKAPAAKAAKLTAGMEPIQIYFHVIRHPTLGTFLVDTGVERALRDAPKKAAIRGFLASYMKFERLKIKVPLGDWLAQHPGPLAGVFFTHLHMDHVSGLADVPHGTPLYAGAGEARHHDMTNGIVGPNIDRAFAGQEPIREWGFVPDADKRFKGVIDVFGDGSVWAISTPGHTDGATAYLVRTTGGPVLLTGDTSHTAWGWKNDVEPGTFTQDQKKNAESLAQLRRLVREHPSIQVRLGHQPL